MFPTDNFSCFLFPKCSGCDRIEAVRSPPILNNLVEFFSKKGVSFNLVSGSITGWRSKAKLAIRGETQFPQIGLFSLGSHQVVDMPFCPHHYSSMNQAVSMIRAKIIEHQIIPYDEKTHTGSLGYIQLLVERKTNKVQLTLGWKKKETSNLEKQFIFDLYKNSSIWHSIWNNFHPEKSNTIFSNEWEFILGEKEFWQEIGGISFCFHPGSFSQAHLEMFEEMLSYVSSITQNIDSLLELYAGVGCISLFLSPNVKKIYMIESSLHAKFCFQKTISPFPEKEKEKFNFFQNSVEEFNFSTFESVDTVIVDPPRKGLSALCKQKIVELDPRQLIYISCGPSSFMRDCEDFLLKGWKLQEAKGFLFFPGTNHVEIVARFLR
jgi:23S rRNA (uracil-5-)-methyltransferase RumA